VSVDLLSVTHPPPAGLGVTSATTTTATPYYNTRILYHLNVLELLERDGLTWQMVVLPGWHDDVKEGIPPRLHSNTRIPPVTWRDSCVGNLNWAWDGPLL
jgi:hypothetical protein